MQNKRNILITAMGYGGSNSLVDSFALSHLPAAEYELFGANVSAVSLAKSLVVCLGPVNK